MLIIQPLYFILHNFLTYAVYFFALTVVLLFLVSVGDFVVHWQILVVDFVPVFFFFRLIETGGRGTAAARLFRVVLTAVARTGVGRLDF